MADADEPSFLLPLFPLPNLVFFPDTRLPLHVFEPRYRAMVADALEGEKQIGIVLLRPGWEGSYYGNPPVHEYATAGGIEHVVRLDDGRYNLLLHGNGRVRILEEVQQDPYRIARVVREAEEPVSVEDAYIHREWLNELASQYLEFLPGQMELQQVEGSSLEGLTNRLISALNVDVQQKQVLLEIDAMSKRAESVAELLKERLEMLEFLAPYRRENDPSKN